MRALGWLLIVGGVLIGCHALNADVDVVAGVPGFRLPDGLNGIRHMMGRQDCLIISGLALMMGAAFAAIGAGAKAKRAADPFERVEIDREHRLKQYAVDLGIRRKAGVYLYEGASFSRLSAAVAVAEHKQNVEPNAEFVAIRDASAKAVKADAAASDINNIVAVASLIISVIVVAISQAFVH
jgi:hypothetical protein